jgi:hypothetical protein
MIWVQVPFYIFLKIPLGTKLNIAFCFLMRMLSVSIGIWLEAQITADVSLKRSGLFCLKKGITPKQLI